MYMRKILSRILMGCYVMAAILFVGACNDDVDIQQSYPFSIETMPVPKKLKVGETAEIRCQLHRDERFEETKYFIRYFQPDGTGTLKMSDGTVLLSNDLYPLPGETFQLYYTSASTDQQTVDVYFQDSFGTVQQLTFSFNNDSSKEEY